MSLQSSFSMHLGNDGTESSIMSIRLLLPARFMGEGKRSTFVLLCSPMKFNGVLVSSASLTKFQP